MVNLLEISTNLYCQQIFEDIGFSVLQMTLLLIFLLYFVLLALNFLKNI